MLKMPAYHKSKFDSFCDPTNPILSMTDLNCLILTQSQENVSQEFIDQIDSANI